MGIWKGAYKQCPFKNSLTCVTLNAQRPRVAASSPHPSPASHSMPSSPMWLNTSMAAGRMEGLGVLENRPRDGGGDRARLVGGETDFGALLQRMQASRWLSGAHRRPLQSGRQHLTAFRAKQNIPGLTQGPLPALGQCGDERGVGDGVTGQAPALHGVEDLAVPV